MRASSVFFFVWLVVLLASATARAQQPSTFDRSTARALAEEGASALDKKDYATAADRFARADALVHAPTFLVRLAEAQVGLGQLVSAQETYSRILREELPPTAPAAFAEARGEAKRALDALLLRIPYLVIQVAGPGAAQAKVTVDGLEVPRVALGVKRAVDPGKHVVRAAASGFASSELRVTLEEGKTLPVTLEPKLPEPAPAPAAPPPPAKRVVPAAAPSSASPRRALGIAGLAVGGASLGLGALMGAMAIAKHAQAAPSCKDGHCPPSVHDQVVAYNTYGAVSTAGFIAGVALAGTGAALLLTLPRAAPKVGSVAIGPACFALEGRF